MTEESPTSAKRFPWFMSGVTITAIIVMSIARRVETYLSDNVFHHDFAILNIAVMIMVPLLVCLWLVWLRLYSGWPRLYARIIPLLLVGAGFVFLILFRPRLDGSLAVMRWEPRFWSDRVEQMVSDDATISLEPTRDLDFPQFLGPNRNGRIENSRLVLSDLKTQLKLVWKQPIGQGCSGFVASGGFAFTMAQNEGDELVVCYELATGKSKWIYRHPARHDDPLSGVGPRSTPTIHEDKIYALGAKGMLVCLDVTNGDPIWKIDLPKHLGIEVTESYRPKGTIQNEQITAIFGRSASPLVYENLVVVPAGGPKEGDSVSLIAFEKSTGREVWRGGTQPLGYASPMVAEIHGENQILITNESSVAGHDPKTGSELWNHPWPGNSDRDASTSQPVDCGNNKILLTKGYGGGAQMIEVVKVSPGVFSVKTLWRNPQVLKTKMTSALIDGDHAFGLSDRILECVDLKTGKRIWKKGRYGHGQMILVNGQLLVHGEKGFLANVLADPTAYNEISRVDTVDGICWNTVCLYGDHILVRSDLEAACFMIENVESGSSTKPVGSDD